MNTFQLECFLSVSEFLNFARAAKHMKISQPAMTNQIKTLEDELHIKLFHRTTRSVELTKEGFDFLDDAKQILSITRNAVDRYAHSTDNDMIRFTIGCTTYMNPDVMIEAIRRLRLIYPNVHPLLRRFPGHKLIDNLCSGSFDAIFYQKLPTRNNVPLSYKELQKSSVICAGTSEFLSNSLTVLHRSDLDTIPLVLYDHSVISPEFANIQYQFFKGRPGKDLYFCEDIESVIFLTQAGYGVSILPAIIIPDLKEELRLIPLDVPPVSFGIYYRFEDQSPVLKAFVKILDSIFEDMEEI